jgi:hypothetical protein
MTASALTAGLAALALSLPPVAPAGLPGSGLVRLTGPSPFARSCEGPGAQRGAEVEPTVAAAPGLLIAAWQQDRYRRGAAAGLGVSVSRDGGASWSTASVPGITECTPLQRYVSDPWLSIGSDGTAYLAALKSRPSRVGFRTRVAISTLAPGAATWSAPALLDGGGNGFNDKPSVTADPARAGSAYAVWTLEGRAFFSRTSDGGRSWSPPALIERAPSADGGLLASTVSALPTGALLHAFTAYGPGGMRLEAARSDDGGSSWSAPVVVARLPRPGVAPGPGRPPVRALQASGTGPAVAPSGTVYEALARIDRSGRGTIATVRSTDGGHSWDPPVSAIRAPRAVFAPALAIDSNGELTISYYGLEPHARLRFYVARSSGAGWRSLGFGVPFSLRRAPVSEGAAFLGDYTGLAALPGGGLAAAFAAAPPLASAGASDVFVAHVGS